MAFYWQSSMLLHTTEGVRLLYGGMSTIIAGST